MWCKRPRFVGSKKKYTEPDTFEGGTTKMPLGCYYALSDMLPLLLWMNRSLCMSHTHALTNARRTDTYVYFDIMESR